MSESIFDSNLEAIEAWNTVLFEKFERFKPLVIEAFSSYSDALLARHPPAAGARVIDIGCGFGDTTVTLAHRVGPTGSAVGVDAAARFIAAARALAAAEGVPNVRFASCDAQADALGGPYDYAFSRFGTMFFASPVAAFRNLRRSLGRRAKLAMVVWRRKEENPFLYDVEQRVLALVPLPAKNDQVTCGPGPFSMASPDLVSTQLRAAGFQDIGFERLDQDLCIGRTLEEALEFAMALGPAGEILRLAGAAAESKRPQVIAALEELLQSFQRADGRVFGGSSAWLVSARTD